MAGYVYLIGAPVFGWYKIGKAKTAEVRIANLGILLPFKVNVLAVWQAEDYHSMERILHEMYKEHRINGEWFEFDRKEVFTLIESIPKETRVDDINESLVHFSNIDQDTKNSKRVLGVRVQKLRGNFTPEEREAKRIAAIEQQRIKKQKE